MTNNQHTVTSELARLTRPLLLTGRLLRPQSGGLASRSSKRRSRHHRLEVFRRRRTQPSRRPRKRRRRRARSRHRRSSSTRQAPRRRHASPASDATAGSGRVGWSAAAPRTSAAPRSQQKSGRAKGAITSATAEDRRYCANLTYPNADDHISLSDSRSVAVERLAQLVGSGLGRRVRIALVAGVRGAAQASSPARAQSRRPPSAASVPQTSLLTSDKVQQP